MIVPAIERSSVAVCRRWIGAECSVCAYAWTQRHRPGWAVYVAAVDALLWWWEPQHCRASAARCKLI